MAVYIKYKRTCIDETKGKEMVYFDSFSTFNEQMAKNIIERWNQLGIKMKIPNDLNVTWYWKYEIIEIMHTCTPEKFKFITTIP